MSGPASQSSSPALLLGLLGRLACLSLELFGVVGIAKHCTSLLLLSEYNDQSCQSHQLVSSAVLVLCCGD